MHTNKMRFSSKSDCRWGRGTPRNLPSRTTWGELISDNPIGYSTPEEGPRVILPDHRSNIFRILNFLDTISSFISELTRCPRAHCTNQVCRSSVRAGLFYTRGELDGESDDDPERAQRATWGKVQRNIPGGFHWRTHGCMHFSKNVPRNLNCGATGSRTSRQDRTVQKKE